MTSVKTLNYHNHISLSEECWLTAVLKQVSITGKLDLCRLDKAQLSVRDVE